MRDTILERCVCFVDGEKEHRERDASRHYKQKTKLKREGNKFLFRSSRKNIDLMKD